MQTLEPNTFGRRKAVAYDVDIVFCIDATSSMQSIIDEVKREVQQFPERIFQYIKETRREMGNLRVRLILFRDYLADGQYAMEATDFFRIPEQRELFNRVVDGIVMDGGGDEPENGLEALAYAMSSAWQKSERKRRQIIVVWTDAPTHDLGFGKDSPYYDPKMPTSFETLSSWWGDGPEDKDAKMDYYAKRLLLFAPEVGWWKTITENWEFVIRIPSETGTVPKEHIWEEIVNLVIEL